MHKRNSCQIEKLDSFFLIFLKFLKDFIDLPDPEPWPRGQQTIVFHTKGNIKMKRFSSF